MALASFKAVKIHTGVLLYMGEKKHFDNDENGAKGKLDEDGPGGLSEGAPPPPPPPHGNEE